MRSVRPDSIKISNGRSNRNLIWWVPACLARLTWLSLRGKVGYVLCGDALMYALCAPVLKVFRIPRATMIMGLDVTYESRFYRALVHPPLRSAAQVIAISPPTAGKAREFGVPADRVVVLRLGVQRPPAGPASRPEARAAIRRRLSLADDQVVLLTLGRLVRRKGVRWFTECVLPRLGKHIHYVVAGDGPEEQPIRAAADAAGVSKRLHLLGRVDDDVREELLTGADVFLQPNIPVPGDMEGFGLVTVEAAMRGTPVVAAELEGIQDAVVNSRTGILLPPADAAAWVSELTGLLGVPTDLFALGDRFRSGADELYSEEAMGRMLCAQLGLGHAEPTAIAAERQPAEEPHGTSSRGH